MNIRIMVDSACDVPQEYVERHNMTVVPMYVNYNGQSYADDGIDLDRNAYYDMLYDIHPLPKTSAPSIGVAKEYVQKLAQEADHIVAVTVAADLSSSYNTLRLALDDLPPERYTMIDSGQLSMGGGWQAIVAAETLEETNGDLEAMLDAVKRVREHQAVYAAVISVEFLRRGGRVSWTQAMVGNLLKIRPIVKVGEGQVNSAARLRTRRAWILKLAELIRTHGELERIALIHTNNLEDLEELKAELGGAMPETVVTVTATPSIGTHTGPYGIGAATLSKSWRKG